MSRIASTTALLSCAGLVLGGVALAGSSREHAYGGPEAVSPQATIAAYDPQYGRAGKRVLVANLDGRSEISADGTKANAGNLVARGLASVAIRGSRICVGIVVLDGGIPVAAHIHEAVKGKNGPVVVPLPTPTPIEPGSVFAASGAGCLVASAPLLSRVRTKPENFYVNVHTGDFPGGAVRGQLRSAKAPATRK